ncbi:SAG1386/EF1546 family surface-associated protein [Limosilactobacillus fermentum]|uniref:SAG1386/EF1546 family surface-associated protein n=1 Tax=Limosilactobacillus fermentum TaxID=1613 RepID=UPI00128D0E0C|nr:SAG1386/EF1546 family surface-associated protein [Limosilactobacillus fermentum]MCD5423224.1 LysM peptidoglycan-binding domain-containing protein [Limosilactobacillus fermentum]MPW03030.1 LysM peptidoglycan-binding domain-containing protein [Limosilactobacillus fermentum]
MAQRREDQRNEKLWDKTFTDNQDIDKEGHLSRMAHRKQSTHNAQITTILIVLIIILAATPVLYWINHQQSFNHPQRTVKVASSSTATSKKKASSTSSSASVSKGKQASSSSSVSKAASTSSSSTTAVYTTVESGQGIYRVAKDNGLTVAELASLNGITTTTAIHPGERLRVK